MATYLNEDFKSLPEQVEENKEKIKEIEDTIGGIDPTLISQVHQNTNDIASIKHRYQPNIKFLAFSA